MHIRISLDTKFQLKLTILISCTKFAQKGCFRFETGKVNSTIAFRIFELTKVPNFSWNWQLWFFGPNLPKNVCPVYKRKSEYQHWILHIRVSLESNFSFTLTVLIFSFDWTFTHGGGQTQWYFDGSSPSSHRDKKSNCLAFLGVNLCENNMDVLDECDILLIELINIEKHGIYEVATTVFLF